MTQLSFQPNGTINNQPSWTAIDQYSITYTIYYDLAGYWVMTGWSYGGTPVNNTQPPNFPIDGWYLSGATQQVNFTGDTGSCNIFITPTPTLTPIPTPCAPCYGYLYNYYVAKGIPNFSSGLWRVPSEPDFYSLLTYINYSGNTLRLIDTTTYWNNLNTNATNSYNFNSKGIGQRSGIDGSFFDIKNSVNYMTSTTLINNLDFCWSLQVSSGVNPLSMGVTSVKSGMAIRLVNNSTTLTNGQTGTYTGYDGKVYNTICIGSQEWMAEDLRETVTIFGPIPNITNNSDWINDQLGAYCIYDNDYGTYTYGCDGCIPTPTPTPGCVCYTVTITGFDTNQSQYCAYKLLQDCNGNDDYGEYYTNDIFPKEVKFCASQDFLNVFRSDCDYTYSVGNSCTSKLDCDTTPLPSQTPFPTTLPCECYYLEVPLGRFIRSLVYKDCSGNSNSVANGGSISTCISEIVDYGDGSATPITNGCCQSKSIPTPTPAPTNGFAIPSTPIPTNICLCQYQTPTPTPPPTPTPTPTIFFNPTPTPTPADPCSLCNCITFINTGLTSTNVYWLDCTGQSTYADLLSGQTIQVCGSVPSYLFSVNYMPFYIGGPCSKVGDVCSCTTDCCQYIVYPSRFGNITLYPIDCNGFILPSVVITPTGSPYSWCGLKYATSGYYLNSQFRTIRVVELSCPCATPAPTPSVPGNICQINWVTTKNTTGVTGCETAEWIITQNNQNIRFNIANSENCGGSCSIRQEATAIAEIVVCQPVVLTITLFGIAEKRNRGFEYIELYLSGYNRIMYASSPGDNRGCQTGPATQTIEIPGPYFLPIGTHQLYIRFSTGDNLYHKDCYYNINLSY